MSCRPMCALVHTAPAPLPLRVQVSRAMCSVPPTPRSNGPPYVAGGPRFFPSPPLLVGPDTVTVVRFDDKSTTVHRVGAPPATSTMSGHGGADYFLMKSFVAAVGTGDPSHLLSGPEETLGRGACLRIHSVTVCVACVCACVCACVRVCLHVPASVHNRTCHVFGACCLSRPQSPT